MQRRMNNAARMECITRWFFRATVVIVVILFITRVLFLALMFGPVAYIIYKLNHHYADRVRYYASFLNSATYVNVSNRPKKH